LLQNDLLEQLILYSTGRTRFEETISAINQLGSQVLGNNRPLTK
jgi:hypothetical protein